jgi:hypothetical protein
LLVEHLARITQTADMNACLFEILIPARQTLSLPGFVILTVASDSTRQIEHMKFGARMAQQMGYVSEPSSVL